uniref:60S ribosomal protein L18a-like protein n=2 Tax=Elaeis guineensis var. tenera TaxID=51953 RepID=A0A6I9QVW2_ELAGV|nr:60S ribosomal protein L18a-like protein [Elaeis guineensis]
MSDEEGKSKGEMGDHHHHHHHHQQYGTFQGAPNYPQPPAMGFPQPAPPPGVTGSPPPPTSGMPYYSQGYQAVPGYAPVVEGRPLREPRLPCCGCGIGWFLFIIGFFLAAIPWYVGAFLLLCARIDYREKPGLVACTIAAIIAAIAIIFGATRGAHVW